MSEDDSLLLFMDNEHYPLVDALPYIDTQLGQTEVAQQVKALIDEEMNNFEPRDYLARLPAPDLLFLSGETMTKEFERIEANQPMAGVEIARYQDAVAKPAGANETDHGAWKKQAENIQLQLEYNRLRLTNLEMLDRFGSKAWIAHSCIVRASERVLANEATSLRAAREEVNKKRKLDQVSCGNELRKLYLELEQYTQDNAEVEKGLRTVETEVRRFCDLASERGVRIEDLVGSLLDNGAKKENGAKSDSVTGSSAGTKRKAADDE